MRSSIIVASFIALAAALPAIVPVEDTSLAVRTESLDATVALEPRQEITIYDQTFSWPATDASGGNTIAQFDATNLGNGNYKFQFWNSGAPDSGSLNYRVSYGGKTLVQFNLARQTSTTVTVPKTGDNFNVYVKR